MFTNERNQNDAMKVLKRCFNGNAQGAGARWCNANNVVMHSLRHTFAMNSLAAEIPVEAIAQMMGHSYTRMTELYARYIPKTNLTKYLK